MNTITLTNIPDPPEGFELVEGDATPQEGDQYLDRDGFWEIKDIPRGSVPAPNIGYILARPIPPKKRTATEVITAMPEGTVFRHRNASVNEKGCSSIYAAGISTIFTPESYEGTEDDIVILEPKEKT